jgi:hypothetical protein
VARPIWNIASTGTVTSPVLETVVGQFAYTPTVHLPILIEIVAL